MTPFLDGANLSVFGGTALFLLRVILGQIFLVHGAKKIAKQEGSGTGLSVFLGIIEVILGFLTIIGYRYDLVALLFGVIIIGAILLKLFVWKNQRYVSNIEYDVLLLVGNLLILTLGPGILAFR